jgi:thymidylate synthase (FAD)
MTVLADNGVTFYDGPVVDLVDFMGDDLSIVRAARVSVVGGNAPEEDDSKVAGLIGYLMRSEHGSPFEHGTMTFYVKAPIFVFREFHRHRIASYNEMSGRYMQLPAEFYYPSPDRPLVNVGTSARPEFAPGTKAQYDAFVDDLMEGYEQQWARYQRALDNGIANEMARIHLPVGIFSQMYVTMNVRALMNFLSLRIDSPDRKPRTRPQYEIQQVAKAMEESFAKAFPLVYDAFLKNGRRAP